ncbi:MAG: hypothetical protein K9J16_05185 [Melioribacteraceae bacterium]|nr:hypothetical protein [Melioribacteraceae bacterium]MCF8354853.1 hypothetical protein [Melioribacteraceae bacterium]MCF8392960.1 hypothetical protein [Melioribacteraceae bacterium]MCF8417297.1 hypothetical protein [Melioribacteraceae bacterium]
MALNSKLFSNDINKDEIKNYSLILKLFWIVGLVSSMLIFLYILFFQSTTYKFNTTIEGFSGFLTVFDFPIKLLTASVVLFGLWLTIERMKQTDKQIDSIVSNNRFNNFYKHREEFLKSFEKFKFLKKIKEFQEHHRKNKLVPPAKKIHIEIDPELAPKLYKTLFYSKAKKFSDKMNDETRSHIDTFIILISSLPMLTEYEIDYDSIDVIVLDEMMNNIPGEITTLTTSLASLDKSNIEHSGHNLMNIPFFTKMNIIYWSATIFKELLEYDGVESEEIGIFINNYNGLREEKGLYN